MTPRSKPGAFDKDAYLSLLTSSRNRVHATRKQIVAWAEHLDEVAAAEVMLIEPHTSIFPLHAHDSSTRLAYEVLRTPKRYGMLSLSLRSEAMRCDLGKLSEQELEKTISRSLGRSKSKGLARALVRFQSFNDRVAALRFLGVDIKYPVQSGAVLPRWIDTMGQYGRECAPRLNDAFEEFFELSAVLNDTMFDFNTLMRPVRYRSIKCTFDVDEFDPLGPSNPQFKVVTSITPDGRRRYNTMEDFKKLLKKKRMVRTLSKRTGGEVDNDAVLTALRALKPRSETPWITNHVIKACYAGRGSKEILATQEEVVAAMQPWAALRSHLQALLPGIRRGKS